jgi:hypothetical protein
MKKILYALGVLLLAVAAVFFMRSYWEKETIALIDHALIEHYNQYHRPSAGYVYYVSPSGSDGNAGTLASPWRSINTAVANLKGGDTLYVRGGTYAETVNVNVSGTASSPITITAYPGELPVIDGGTTLPNGNWGALIAVYGNYNTVSGFEVKNSNINGVYEGGAGIVVSGHHNIIRKMNVHHAWENGILAQGDYNIVEDSRVWQTTRRNLNGIRQGWWASGLSAARNNSSAALIPGITSYATLRRNTVFNNWGEGLSCYETDHCILEDNIVYDNWTVNLYLSDAKNSLVQRNLVYISSNPSITTVSSTWHPGIVLADELINKPRSSNNTVINNLIYNADFNAFSWTNTPAGLANVLIANNTIVDGNLLTGSGSTIINNKSQISNNIITGRNSKVPSNSGITFSYNNWAVTPTLAASSTNIIADPQLARTGVTTAGNLTPDYFKLLADSPLIGAGLPLPQLSDDFFKNLRTGSVIDIGAYQFQTSGVDSTAPSTPTNMSATAISSTQVNLAWNASTDKVGVTGYKIYRDGKQIGSSTVASLVDAAATGGTTYNYTVIAFDLAGNASALSNTATVTTPAAIIPVSITSNNTGGITTTSAQINWTTNIPSTGVVSYGTSAANLSATANTNNLSTTQSVQITGLTSNTLYYFKITAGGSSVTSSFNTLTAAPTPPPKISATNIALLASVTASSQNTGTNQQAIKAVDGIISGCCNGDSTKEWATINGRAGSWLQLNWKTAYLVNQVVLYDRPNTNDQITSATLTFSDGSKITSGALNNAGASTVINFTPRITTLIRVTATTVSGSTRNVGLSEIQVFGVPSTSSQVPVTNIATLASATASSQNTGNNQQATKAIDDVINGYPGDSTREWATIAQKAGAWIQLNWNSTRTVSQVVLYDRPNTNDQITSATLTFSNGSSVKVGSLNNSGGAVVINFTPVVTNSLRLTVNTVSSSTSNIGLSELRVYGF